MVTSSPERVANIDPGRYRRTLGSDVAFSVNNRSIAWPSLLQCLQLVDPVFPATAIVSYILLSTHAVIARRVRITPISPHRARDYRPDGKHRQDG
jgi:hypothetical protein